MDDWKPATLEEVSEIVARDLKDCDGEQLAAFDKYRVEPFSAPIVRYGQTESVVVVARNGDQVIYYEDVEDGFNVSPISSDGRVLEHWCNQDELRSRSMRGLMVGDFGVDSGLPSRSMSEIACLRQ